VCTCHCTCHDLWNSINAGSIGFVPDFRGYRDRRRVRGSRPSGGPVLPSPPTFDAPHRDRRRS
jgi:hypothetical protein